MAKVSFKRKAGQVPEENNINGEYILVKHSEDDKLRQYNVLSDGVPHLIKGIDSGEQSRLDRLTNGMISKLEESYSKEQIDISNESIRGYVDIKDSATNQRIDDVNLGITGSITTSQTLSQLNALPDGIYEAETDGVYANGFTVAEGEYVKFKKVGTVWTVNTRLKLSTAGFLTENDIDKDNGVASYSDELKHLLRNNTGNYSVPNFEWKIGFYVDGSAPSIIVNNDWRYSDPVNCLGFTTLLVNIPLMDGNYPYIQWLDISGNYLTKTNFTIAQTGIDRIISVPNGANSFCICYKFSVANSNTPKVILSTDGSKVYATPQDLIDLNIPNILADFEDLSDKVNAVNINIDNILKNDVGNVIVSSNYSNGFYIDGQAPNVNNSANDWEKLPLIDLNSYNKAVIDFKTITQGYVMVQWVTNENTYHSKINIATTNSNSIREFIKPDGARYLAFTKIKVDERPNIYLTNNVEKLYIEYEDLGGEEGIKNIKKSIFYNELKGEDIQSIGSGYFINASGQVTAVADNNFSAWEVSLKAGENVFAKISSDKGFTNTNVAVMAICNPDGKIRRLVERHVTLNRFEFTVFFEPNYDCIVRFGSFYGRVRNRVVKNVTTFDSTKPISTLQNSKVLDFKADINHILNYGQSLSLGADSQQTFTDRPIHPNFLRLKVDKTDFEPYFNGGNEIPMGGLGVALKDLEVLNDYKVLATNTGQGSASIEQLSKGTTPYNNTLQAISDCYDICQQQGKSYNVYAMCWTQSEGNLGTNPVTYKNLLKQLRNDLNADIKAITNQSNDIKVIMYQMSSWKSYQPSSTVTLAFLDMALTEEGFYMSNPQYDKRYFPNGTIMFHMYGQSYRQLGAEYGIVLNELVKGKDYKPLYPLDITYQGKIINIRLSENVVIDTSIVIENVNYGFDITNNIIETINVNNNNIVIFCSNNIESGQRLQYAFIGDNTSGYQTGPRGNIRSKEGILLSFDFFYKWLAHFRHDF